METKKTTEKERIEMIMTNETMKSSQFAEEIGIKSPTLSHILNGRNNPSLDIMQRVLKRFNYINPQWLILGEGEMYSQKKESNGVLPFDDFPKIQTKSVNDDENIMAKNEKNKDVITNSQKNIENNIHSQINVATPKKMIKIIVYYDDNSFEELLPTKK